MDCYITAILHCIGCQNEHRAQSCVSRLLLMATAAVLLRRNQLTTAENSYLKLRNLLAEHLHIINEPSKVLPRGARPCLPDHDGIVIRLQGATVVCSVLFLTAVQPEMKLCSRVDLGCVYRESDMRAHIL